MEEFYEIMRYLPASYKSPEEQNYNANLVELFPIAYDAGKYDFALFSCHMLYMSFVFFSLWQIKKALPNEFASSMVGFQKDEETRISNAQTPYVFSSIKEKTVFRFFKLLGCKNEAIGKFAKLVDYRNDIAHPNGIIQCKEQKDADFRLSEVLAQMKAIQLCMIPVIHSCLREFLLSSGNPDTREYPDPTDQIREILIHANYFSEKDIEACLSFDISELAECEGYQEITALYQAFTIQHSISD